MNSPSLTFRSRTRRLLAPLGLLAGACFLVLGGRALFADGGPCLPSGGDAIGSLPKTGGPEAFSAPTRPSIVLEGACLEDIEALVVDAYGEGYAQVFEPDAAGRVRVELQGRVSVILDRVRLDTLGVSVRLDVSQGFSGGIAVVSQGSRISGTQMLPPKGDLLLPLQTLAHSGVLDVGPLTLHSISPQMTHHILEMSGSGATLRLSSRD